MGGAGGALRAPPPPPPVQSRRFRKCRRHVSKAAGKATPLPPYGSAASALRSAMRMRNRKRAEKGRKWVEREEEALWAPSGSGALHPEAACGEMAEAVSEGHGDSNAAPEDVREGLGDVWGGGNRGFLGAVPVMFSRQAEVSEGCRLPVLRRNQDNEDEWRERGRGFGGGAVGVAWWGRGLGEGIGGRGWERGAGRGGGVWRDRGGARREGGILEGGLRGSAWGRPVGSGGHGGGDIVGRGGGGSARRDGWGGNVEGGG